MFFRTSIKLFSILILIFVITRCSPDTDIHPVKEAPDFTLKSITGEKISLKDFKGSVVLVDFWATWCGPCRISIPELVKIQEKYGDKGVSILGISLDDPDKTDDMQLQRFVEKYRMNYHVMRGGNDIMISYFGTASAPIPTMFVIDQDGKIVETVSGFQPGKVEKIIKRLL